MPERLPADGADAGLDRSWLDIVGERWTVAALRHRKFFSLAELNQAIWELLAKLNQRPFRKRPGCRASLFQEPDRPALQPLPTERYEFHRWASARVNIDYHLEFEHHYDSVPYTLTGQLVEIRATMTSVEIFCRGERAVCSTGTVPLSSQEAEIRFRRRGDNESSTTALDSSRSN